MISTTVPTRRPSLFATADSATPKSGLLPFGAYSSKTGPMSSKPQSSKQYSSKTQSSKRSSKPESSKQYSSGLLPSDGANHSSTPESFIPLEPEREGQGIEAPNHDDAERSDTVVAFAKRPSDTPARPRSSASSKRTVQSPNASAPSVQSNALRETGMNRKAMQNVRIDILHKEMAGEKWTYKALASVHGCSESSIKVVIDWMAERGEMHQPNGKGSKWRITHRMVQQLKEKGVA